MDANHGTAAAATSGAGGDRGAMAPQPAPHAGAAAGETSDGLQARRRAEQSAKVSAAALTAALARTHEIAVVLGSGWAQAAQGLGPVLASVDAADIPGMRAPEVAGHGGQVLSVSVDEQRAALVFLGRTHLYEGLGPHAVAHTVRTAAEHGCRVVVLTNGCGAINPAFTPGQVVLVNDHINLTAQTALVGPEFVDLTDLYSARLRRLALQAEPSLAQGVYAQFHGPQYETPAEIRMARVLGADLVGMSTAVEAVAAKAAGLEVLCLSLVTNMAAGVTGDPISHAEVLAAGAAAQSSLGALLRAVVQRVSQSR